MQETKFCIDCKYYTELNNLCARPRNDGKSYIDLVTGKVHNTTRYIKSYDERYETKDNNCGKSGVFFVKSVQSKSLWFRIRMFLSKSVE
jgi:hypothetical protein